MIRKKTEDQEIRGEHRPCKAYQIDIQSVHRHDVQKMAPDTVSRIREIPPHQLGRRRLFPVIIDVREEVEFILGHINGAKRIRPNRLEESIRDIVPHLTTPIALDRAADDRCAAVADHLQKMGPRHIYPEGWPSRLAGSQRISRAPHKIEMIQDPVVKKSGEVEGE